MHRGVVFWFVLALATRLAFLFGIGKAEWPHSVLYEGDATTWVRWARQLAAGEAFDFDLPIWPPGTAYVLFLLGVGKAGASMVPAKLVWCAASAATVALLFGVVRRTLSERVAWIAAALACFSFGAYVTATSLNSEVWYGLAVVGLVGATSRLARRPTIGLAAVVGGAHGLTLLFRPEHMALLGLFALWVAGSRRADASRARSPRNIGAGALTFVVAVLVCIPWSVRGAGAVERFNTQAVVPDYANAAPPWTDSAREYLEGLPAFARDGNFRFVNTFARAEGVAEVGREDVRAFFDERFGYVPRPLGRWTLVSMNGPLDFALANHPESTGGFSRAGLRDEFGESPTFSFGRPSHLELFQRGVPLGLGWIADDPVGWFVLVGRKLGIFADGAVLGVTGWNLPYGRGGLRRQVDLVVPYGGWTVFPKLLIGAWLLAGAAVALRRRAGGPWLAVIGYKLVVTIFFYGYARQAASIQPAFCVVAALALDELFRWFELRGRELPLRAAGIVIVALLATADVVHSVVGVHWNVRFVDESGGPLPGDAFGRGVLVTNDAIEITPRTE